MLRQLHWLPVRRRVEYKLAVFTYRALHHQAPAYLVEDCRLVADSGRRSLRSADTMNCIVPRTHNSFGDRSFAVAGPHIWNSLPPHLRQPDIGLDRFRRDLKTYLFTL